jgi:hypothetical protein
MFLTDILLVLFVAIGMLIAWLHARRSDLEHLIEPELRVELAMAHAHGYRVERVPHSSAADHRPGWRFLARDPGGYTRRSSQVFPSAAAAWAAAVASHATDMRLILHTLDEIEADANKP